MQTPPVNYTVPCTKATAAQIQTDLTPPAFPKLPLAKSPDLPQTPPAVPGYCNADMPTDSTLNRYVWTVAQFVNEVPAHLLGLYQLVRIWQADSACACLQGFYVNVDYHSNNYTNDVANGDGAIFDKPTWMQTWTYLLETIVKSVPQAQGRLLIDLINEPDGCADPLSALSQGTSDQAKDHTGVAQQDLCSQLADSLLLPACQRVAAAEKKALQQSCCEVLPASKVQLPSCHFASTVS